MIADFKQCTWCQDFIPIDLNNSISGMCMDCQGEFGEIDKYDITEIPRTFVDNLPFGNIILDPNNKIVRYNATEAKYTGYNPTVIEGKNFFTQVAPCAGVRNFQGELERLKEDGRNGQIEFKFEFTHPRFHSLVSILITYFSETSYSIVSIKKIKDY